jgi:hypothetical protein
MYVNARSGPSCISTELFVTLFRACVRLYGAPTEQISGCYWLRTLPMGSRVTSSRLVASFREVESVVKSAL